MNRDHEWRAFNIAAGSLLAAAIVLASGYSIFVITQIMDLMR